MSERVQYDLPAELSKDLKRIQIHYCINITSQALAFLETRKSKSTVSENMPDQTFFEISSYTMPA
jgi:hypothetical protein